MTSLILPAARLPLCSRTTFLALLLASLSPAAGAAGPRPNDPIVSIPLASLNFELPQQRLLLSGASMYTVNFVDSSHLLLTFNTHGLIPRLPDTQPGDDDRLVTALLLELPSGKILGKTVWHLRDRDQYLWPLGHGLFLLRNRTHLSVIDPVRAPASEPFHEQPFLDMDRRIGFISLSPDGDLLIVETLPPPRPALDDAARFAAANGAAPPPAAEPNDHPGLQTRGSPPLTVATHERFVEIHFFRMDFLAETGKPPHLAARSAGFVAAKNLIRVAATSEGFIDVSKESAQTWLFDFQAHAGKRLELAPFDTTCAPSPWFISRTEFVALGCRGSDTRLQFSGFNFRGEQPWVQVLAGQQAVPVIVPAPEAGRFAFSRLLVSNSFYDIQNLIPEDIQAQEIAVIQHHDGRILLRVQASPMERTGQNFDLSADGLSFTVIRNGNLEVYRLPPLSAKDQQQLKLAARDVPEKSDVRIRLMRPETAAGEPLPATQPPAQPDAQPAPTALLPAAPTPQPPAAQPSAGQAPATQPAEDEPRAPPSLYGPDHPKPSIPE